jgi:hypothetical protein
MIIFKYPQLALKLILVDFPTSIMGEKLFVYKKKYMSTVGKDGVVTGHARGL